MDRILVKDLEVYAYHGVFNEEKTLGQKFLITMELFLNLRKAGTTGDLNASVHYGELSHKVEEEFKRKSYDLIEEAGENLAKFILLEYPIVKNVKVNIKKPWAPIGRPLDYVEVSLERAWHKAYIALGSNMGDKEKNLKDAINALGAEDTRVTRVSTFIKTEPWGYEEQEEFLNGVCEIETLLDPNELMKKLLSIESELKRERIIRWGPRTIDLDILLYDDLVTEDENCIIPHPRMHERLFVLEPLSEIAKNKIHPMLNKRIIDLVNELKV